jgi:hypothetical protein
MFYIFMSLDEAITHVFHKQDLRSALLRCAPLCSAPLRCALLRSALLRCTLLRCALICCAAMCSALLCSPLLWCAAMCSLCSALLRCALLRCAVLCCAALCSALLRCALLCSIYQEFWCLFFLQTTESHFETSYTAGSNSHPVGRENILIIFTIYQKIFKGFGH